MITGGSGFQSQVFNFKDLHQMEPMGLALGADRARPLLLLRSVLNSQVLPVGLNPLEAGVALGQAPQSRIQTSPHHLLQFLLTSFGVQIEKAIFSEIKGPHQFVDLFFKNHPHLTQSRFRAEEVMSCCLHLQAPILAPAEFIQQSRVLNASLENLHDGLLNRPEVLKAPHLYLM